ncbi:MAG TPA: protein kinase [Mucilaginibacter sp.]
MESLIKTNENTVMKLNQYEWDPALDILGKGAFAEVFKAKDQKGNDFALKIYTEAILEGSTGGSSHGKYTLEREYEKGKSLSHTNVIRYIDFDYMQYVDAMQRHAKYPVLIMEYADEGSLSALLRTTQPDVQEAVRITREILNGLGYLHTQGIIHRDLKPGNILLKKDRVGNKVAKISDFGISRDLLEFSADGASATAGIGTVEYMAPEQLQKKTYGLNGEISERTDLWAVGVIFYRLLTGKMPFGDVNKGYENTYDEIINKEPDYRAVPVKYQPVIKGCLRKYASARPETAQSVLDMLTQIGKMDDGGTTILDDHDKDKKKKRETPIPPKRSPIGKYIAIAAAVILVIALWVRFGMGSDTVTDKIFKNSDSIQYTYTGAVKDGLPDGTGTANYMNYDIRSYNGEWKDGKKNGHGTETYNDGTTYVGEFKDDKRDGQGSYTYKSKESYNGEWKRGFRDGKGIDSLPNGDIYNGEFEKNSWNGHGAFIGHTGENYKGEWVNGQKSGQGTWKNENGDLWSGMFSKNLPNGQDTVILKNTDEYIGTVTDGHLTGTGTLYFKENDQFKGDKYQGELLNGAENGRGTYYWNSGKMYTGDWKSGEPDGQGRMDYPGDGYYDGEWKMGNYNGVGDRIFKDGSGYKANWVNGKVFSYIASYKAN